MSNEVSVYSNVDFNNISITGRTHTRNKGEGGGSFWWCPRVVRKSAFIFSFAVRFRLTGSFFASLFQALEKKECLDEPLLYRKAV